MNSDFNIDNDDELVLPILLIIFNYNVVCAAVQNASIRLRLDVPLAT